MAYGFYSAQEKLYFKVLHMNKYIKMRDKILISKFKQLANQESRIFPISAH